MLRIRNISKIVGESVESKWLPNTSDWFVSNVEDTNDSYIFELINTDVSMVWTKAEIQLNKGPLYSPETFDIVYKMWAMNYETGMMEHKMLSKCDLDTIRNAKLWIGVILDKIIPTK